MKRTGPPSANKLVLVVLCICGIDRLLALKVMQLYVLCAHSMLFLLLSTFFQKIPEKFVQQHLTETYTYNHQNSIIVCSLGKFWRVELQREQPDVLLRDGWAPFLAAHDLSEGNILLFRYEGNMVFTVEVFLQNGCLKEYKTAALYLTDGTEGPSNAPQQSKPVAFQLRCSFNYGFSVFLFKM